MTEELLPIAVGFVALAIVTVGAVSVALARGARLAPTAGARASRIPAMALALSIGWLALVVLLARAGFFQAVSLPPRIPLAAVSVTMALGLLTKRKALAALFAPMPLAWLIAFQSFRVPIELLLWALHRAGSIPKHMTFEGRNFDVLVGLSAPVLAWLLQQGKVGSRTVLLWNVASLGLLANIVIMAITSLPGPIHLAWDGPLPFIIAEAPFIWLPTWFVPLAITGHVLVFRRLSKLAHGAPALAPK